MKNELKKKRSKLSNLFKLTGIVLINVFYGKFFAQNFSNPQINPFGIMCHEADNAFRPSLVDIDGDGDLDYFGSSGLYQGNIVFQENIGTSSSPNFTITEENPFGLNPSYADMPIFADLDADGDLDILSTQHYQGVTYYYENVGDENNPSFSGSSVMNVTNEYNGFDVIFTNLIDIDGDGDLDLFGSCPLGGIIYLENSGNSSSPSFLAPVSNPFGINAPNSNHAEYPEFFDIDNDGDSDLFYAEKTGLSTYDIAYHENIGNGNNPLFGPRQNNVFDIDFQNVSLFIPMMSFADIDSDGDYDLFVSDDGYNSQPCIDDTSRQIAYFENITQISSEVHKNSESSSFNIYPNPVLNMLNIRSLTYAEKNIVDILSVDGKLVKSYFFNGSDSRFNISDLPTGIYIIEIIDKKRTILLREKFVKK